jgi:hypothetical protein
MPKPPRFCVTRCAQTLTQKHSGFGAAEARRYIFYQGLSLYGHFIVISNVFNGTFNF